MATPREYRDSVIGKRFDEDGVFGAQCVDAFKHFCRTVLDFNISSETICAGTGYATSIWDNYESLGLDKYFDKVPSNNMVEGDWTIWSIGSKECPDSHIAMFLKDMQNGKGLFLGQNQMNKKEYTECPISYHGVRGGLRPKIYHQKQYINIDADIVKRNFYDKDTNKLKGQLSPKKFGGLSYDLLGVDGQFAIIPSVDFGVVKIKITSKTPITNTPQHKHGNWS